VAAILANTEDVDGRAVKTTIGELLQAEFTNISENLHEDSDILDHDAEKPQNSPNDTTTDYATVRNWHAVQSGQITYPL
jgi:hypothetical protein